jgi:hypothetical protein
LRRCDHGWRNALSLAPPCGLDRMFVIKMAACSRKEVAMQVEVFRGTGRVFAFSAAGSANDLPKRYASWTLFKSIELVRGQVQPGVDADDCLDDIGRYGIHVTDAHVRITEQTIG